MTHDCLENVLNYYLYYCLHQITVVWPKQACYGTIINNNKSRSTAISLIGFSYLKMSMPLLPTSWKATYLCTNWIVLHCKIFKTPTKASKIFWLQARKLQGQLVTFQRYRLENTACEGICAEIKCFRSLLSILVLNRCALPDLFGL